MKKIIQSLYLIAFLLTGMVISGEKVGNTPIWFTVLFITSGILSIGKVIYGGFKNENN